MWKTLLAYLVTAVSTAIGYVVQQKTGSVAAGLGVGGAVATGAARVLHLQPSPNAGKLQQL